MNVLVIGSGRLGRYLASLLDQEGHDVAVIDENADNFRQLDKDFSGITVEVELEGIGVLRSRIV